MIITQATSLKMPSQCNLIRIQAYTCIPLMAVIVLPVAVQSVPITTKAARSNPAQVYLIPHQMLKFVSDLRQVHGFLRVLRFLHNKTDRHDIPEILLKLSLSTINKAKPFENRLLKIYFLSCKSKVQTETVMLNKSLIIIIYLCCIL